LAIDIEARASRKSSKLLRVAFFWRNNSGEPRAISSVTIDGRQRHALWATLPEARSVFVRNHPVKDRMLIRPSRAQAAFFLGFSAMWVCDATHKRQILEKVVQNCSLSR
jgi:hypothetical protein